MSMVLVVLLALLSDSDPSSTGSKSILHMPSILKDSRWVRLPPTGRGGLHLFSGLSNHLPQHHDQGLLQGHRAPNGDRLSQMYLAPRMWNRSRTGRIWQNLHLDDITGRRSMMPKMSTIDFDRS